jgi:hypothetical protein
MNTIDTAEWKRNLQNGVDAGASNAGKQTQEMEEHLQPR